MRRCVVAKLACPECRGNVEITEVFEQSNLRILRGTLRCVSCLRCYPINKGVPRLVKAAPDVAEVCRRYSFQWASRWNGKFETRRCYGFDDDLYVEWVKKQLECRRMPAAGDWLLDAGCGSGEKTQVLARKCPMQSVVGLDLGVESLEKAVAAFGEMPNLDYVQGNIIEPPFKDHAFDAGMSLGVLHHTNNTRQALGKFRRMLNKTTTCVIWIYPTYREGPEWRMPYLARDLLILGQGYRMPTSLLRALAHAIVVIWYPIVQPFFWKNYRRIGRDLPFFRVEAMTLKEQYQAQVFFCFDTLLPGYQWRHKVKDVESWLVEEGLEPVLHLHGFYTASNAPLMQASGNSSDDAVADPIETAAMSERNSPRFAAEPLRTPPALEPDQGSHPTKSVLL